MNQNKRSKEPSRFFDNWRHQSGKNSHNLLHQVALHRHTNCNAKRHQKKDDLSTQNLFQQEHANSPNKRKCGNWTTLSTTQTWKRDNKTASTKKWQKNKHSTSAKLLTVALKTVVTTTKGHLHNNDARRMRCTGHVSTSNIWKKRSCTRLLMQWLRKKSNNSPSHVTPSPVKPVWHAQLKLPFVFVHIAHSASQLSLCSWHSSISGKTTLLCKNKIFAFRKISLELHCKIECFFMRKQQLTARVVLICMTSFVAILPDGPPI